MGFSKVGLRLGLGFVFFGVLNIDHARSADGLDSLLSQARERFAQRDAQEDDKATLDTITILANVGSAPTASDADKTNKYLALCLLSRAYYFAGSNTSSTVPASKVKRIALLERGKKAAKTALGIFDGYADAHYFYAINLSRWALTTDAILGHRSELDEHLRKTINGRTIDGQPGMGLDDYGPLRVRGRAAFKLPYLFGRNDTLAMNDLKLAAQKAPYVASNQIFYAAILNRKSAKSFDGRTAKQVIADLVGSATSPSAAAEDFVKSFAGDPTFAPLAAARAAETKKDFREDLQETASEVRVKLPW